MKLTVNKYLNARQGAPSTAAPNPMYHSPGTILTIDKVHTGTAIQGNSIWYHCPDDGYFYWSGGFAETDFQLGTTHLHDFTEEEQVRILLSITNNQRHTLHKRVIDYRGLGLGDKNYDPSRKMALSIYVGKKTSDKAGIAPNICYMGIMIPTDIKESSVIERYSAKWDEGPIYRIGGSVGRIQTKEKGGARTLKVTKDNKVYLLGCYHVMLYDLTHQKRYLWKKGDNYRVQFPYSSGLTPTTSFLVTYGQFNAEYDFAVAELVDYHKNFDNVVGSQKIRVNGFYKKEDQDASRGTYVTIYGNKTETKTGKILEPRTSLQIGNEPFETVGIIISESISENGDSGSPVFDNKFNLVGYVIGGGVVKNKDGIPISITCIMPYYKIDEVMKYKLFTI